METKREEQAEEFAERFGQEFGVDLSPENIETLKLRTSLVMEEAFEVQSAATEVEETLERGSRPSHEKVAHLLKELADLQYVLSGYAVAFSLPLVRAVDEVHESNMSKLGPDGMAQFDEAGKVQKGKHYRPAEMERVLEDHHYKEYKKENL